MQTNSYVRSPDIQAIRNEQQRQKTAEAKLARVETAGRVNLTDKQIARLQLEGWALSEILAGSWTKGKFVPVELYRYVPDPVF